MNKQRTFRQLMLRVFLTAVLGAPLAVFFELSRFVPDHNFTTIINLWLLGSAIYITRPLSGSHLFSYVAGVSGPVRWACGVGRWCAAWWRPHSFHSERRWLFLACSCCSCGGHFSFSDTAWLRGCASHISTAPDLTNASETELHRHIGQSVTLQGLFSLRGKVGPFILIRDRPVYLISHHEQT